MFFDAMLLARAKAEIERELLGPRVREVVQLHHDEVALAFGRGPGPVTLLLSSSPQFGRVHLSGPLYVKGQAQAFGLALRKHLRGARLASVAQPGFDRVLRLEFAECEGFGTECRRTLVVEVMGKHGNMALLDEEERILSCAKHVPARLNRYREIMEGEPYLPPPSFDKLDPREATADGLRDRMAPPLSTFLRDHILGAGKVFAAEVVARLGESPPSLDALAALLRALPAEAACPGPVYVYAGPTGSGLPARFAHPVPLQCAGPPTDEAPNLGAALAPLALAERTAQRERELRERLSGCARAHLRDLADRLSAMQAQVRKAEKSAALRRTAELLLAQPHAAQPYASEVELTDYFTEGAPTITVPLDPPGDALGAAQRLFDRCKRAARTLERVPPLIEQVERETEYLTAVLAEIDLAQDLEDLTGVRDELRQEGYLRERQQTRKPSLTRAARPQPRQRVSADGLPILYGANHLQNDELVRLAAPDDLWLHVQAAPGSHVLIRTNSHPERVPRRTLLEAATLAAQLSRLRNQDTVEVDYTLAKHVRRQKGERPGMVFYTHQKTVTVRPGERPSA